MQRWQLVSVCYLIFNDAGGSSFPRNISVSGLSDSLRAPGINSLSCVHEMASSSDMSVEETETPPCEDAQIANILSSEDESCRYGF